MAAVEAKLGILHGKSRIPNEDVQTRLGELKSQFEASTDQGFRDSCTESDKLLRELDAGTAMTHQTSVSSTPLYYRRQEVLATSDDLKDDMDKVAQMLHLLMVGQTPREEGKPPLREEEATGAPIVNLSPVSRDEERRLDLLQANIGDIGSRTQAIGNRVDALLKLYYSLVATASEKIVLADEEVAVREQKK